MNNLIIISLDCVRREAIGCYHRIFPSYFHNTIPALNLRGMRRLKRVYEPVIDPIIKWLFKPKTSYIDCIASNGILFTQAVSQAPYTPASHASIFTGLNPFNHGIRHFIGFKISPEVLTLAEVLKSFGFQTGGFIGSNALGEFYGFDRGFDVYDCNFNSKQSICEVGNLKIFRRDHREITERVLQWLNEIKDKFFLFIHYFDVHESSVPITYQPFYQILKMREIDGSIGKIVQFLKDNGLYDNTIIIVLSDHGNDFGIHEPGHREFLFDTTILVPLIIKADKSLSGLQITRQVRLIDIMPTAVELLGLSIDNQKNYMPMDGVSLLPLCNDNCQEELPAYSETCIEYSSKQWNILKNSFMSLRVSGWKLVVDKINHKKYLYNISKDPFERNNLCTTNKDMADFLTHKLDNLQTQPTQPSGIMTENEISMVKESLKGLGYLDD
ncbi:MAG TPA: sulfatase [Candidatus Wujingus californicus]|nr:sulfatase [Planctomycetota bacterium]MDO8130478.1 sulfatase [Candidatus Brocadiales bacterium]